MTMQLRWVVLVAGLGAGDWAGGWAGLD